MITINKVEFLEDGTLVTFNIGNIQDCKLLIDEVECFDIEHIEECIQEELDGSDDVTIEELAKYIDLISDICIPSMEEMKEMCRDI